MNRRTVLRIGAGVLASGRVSVATPAYGSRETVDTGGLTLLRDAHVDGAFVLLEVRTGVLKVVNPRGRTPRLVGAFRAHASQRLR